MTRTAVLSLLPKSGEVQHKGILLTQKEEAAELCPVPYLLLWMWSWSLVDFTRWVYKGKEDLIYDVAFGVCCARFPGWLPGHEAALPTTCCGLRRRQKLCWAEARLLPDNCYLCVAVLNLLIVLFASP